MKQKPVLFSALSFLLVLAGCQLQALKGPQSDSKIQTFSRSDLYQKGDFVFDQGTVYMALTAVKDVAPANRIASAQAPLYPWSLSSENEAVKKLEARSAAPLAALVPLWDSSAIYLANDVAQKDGKYFKSFWWNTANDPSDVKNQNNVLSGGVTYWGPWLPITKEQAEALAGSSVTNTPIITNVGPTNTNSQIVTNTNIIVGTNEKPSEVTPDIAQKYAWSSAAIYLENNVAIFNDKYFRAKWWTQGNEPVASPVNPWDTPWEVVSKDVFLALLSGTPPPVIQPPVTTNTNTGGGATNTNIGPVTPPSEAYAFLYANGYIKEWDIVADAASLPENLKAEIAKINRSATSGAKNFFTSKLSAAQWNQLFPRRRGTPAWTAESGKTAEDYYSYANFEQALEILGRYVYFIEVALDPSTSAETFFQRNYVLNKTTGKLRLINQNEDYFAADASWLLNRPYKVKVVDYNNFGNEGSDNDKIRVIAGFLAHASHETSGSWATAPGYAFNRGLFPGSTLPAYVSDTLPGELAWSLYFNEEVAFSGATSSHYQDDYNKIFPPTRGQSYHGRGAFQLSWNYNYGLASAIFFGTSKVLLDNPNMIMNGGTASGSWINSRIEGGTLAYLSSLMFWLTPQGPKPSQQDTMVLNRPDGRYVPGTAKLTKVAGLGEPGYGWTINIMNGGYEANKSWEEGKPNYDAKVARRVKHYKFFTQALGGNNDGEVMDTYGNHSY